MDPEILDALMEAATGPQGLFGKGGVLETLKGALMQRMLEAEMTEHLGYEKHTVTDIENARNGYSEKTVHTESGATTIQIPRDREASFEPRLVPKHSRRLEGFDAKVLALYSRGLPTREIQAYLAEIYGVEISPDLISRVTDAVVSEMEEWRARPVDAVYPVIFLDALFVSIRSTTGLVFEEAFTRSWLRHFK
jgi:putative transposase